MLIAWGAKLTEAERARLLEVAAEIGCDPSHLSACIEFESRWNPAAVNAATLATGLIQFMPSTAAVLGTTVANLHSMTRLQQLDYVLRYLKPFAGRLRTLSDCYMAILWPRAVGKPEGYVVFADGSAAYVANAALDVDHDGQVTKAECAEFVVRRLAQGLLPENAAPAPQAPAGDAQPTPTPQPPPAPAGAPMAPPAQPATPPQPEKRMPILALLSAFGPLLGQLIPQIAKVVNPTGEVAQRNVAIAEAVVNTVVQASGQPNVQAAVEAMQADPELTRQVTEAVVTSPTLMQWLEVGGGITEARKADAVATQAEHGFWWSPVFWISVLLLPLVYLVVYRVLWADPPFSDEMRVMVVTAIATGLLGSITGYFMGSAMGSQRKDDTINALTKR